MSSSSMAPQMVSTASACSAKAVCSCSFSFACYVFVTDTCQGSSSHFLGWDQRRPLVLLID
jgi:hypothetical protein